MAAVFNLLCYVLPNDLIYRLKCLSTIIKCFTALILVLSPTCKPSQVLKMGGANNEIQYESAVLALESMAWKLYT